MEVGVLVSRGGGLRSRSRVGGNTRSMGGASPSVRASLSILILRAAGVM